MAQIKGFFNEEGLQAELIRLRSAVVLPALTSGEIDYHTVVSPAINAALRGIPTRVVACFTPGLTTAIIARPEIKTIQDLKGKTIGLNSSLRIALDEAKKSVNISREIAFNEVADFTVWREAQKEMGLK